MRAAIWDTRGGYFHLLAVLFAPDIDLVNRLFRRGKVDRDDAPAIRIIKTPRGSRLDE